MVDPCSGIPGDGDAFFLDEFVVDFHSPAGSVGWGHGAVLDRRIAGEEVAQVEGWVKDHVDLVRRALVLMRD